MGRRRKSVYEYKHITPKVTKYKMFDDQGCVYPQRITISTNQYLGLREAMHSEIAMNFPRRDQYCSTDVAKYPELFLTRMKGTMRTKGTLLVFLTCTQRNYLNLFLKLNLDDDNTYLAIK